MSNRAFAAVIRQGSEYLICQRPAHEPQGGTWVFPGGKLDEDETLLGGALRHITNRLDVKVRAVGSPLFATPDPDTDCLIEFVPVTIEGEPRCRECSALRWLPLEDLTSLVIGSADRLFVEFLESAALKTQRQSQRTR